MTDILWIATALISGYLLGSLNTAILVGKLYRKNILEHGSKSAGLTNTLRVLGKRAAILVLAGDVLKGILACLLGIQVGVNVTSVGAINSVSLLAAGAGAVLGHNWPIFFGFKGGKGALTAITVLFMLNWMMALISLGVFLAIVAASRYVSLGTISAALLFVALSFIPIFETTHYFTIFACLMASLVIFKHRENIRRLLAGRENKLIL